MPLWKQWSAGGAVWGIWKVTESPSELRAMLVEQLPYETELGSLKSPSRKLEYLVVRVLLKALAGEEFDIAHLPSTDYHFTYQGICCCGNSSFRFAGYRYRTGSGKGVESDFPFHQVR